MVLYLVQCLITNIDENVFRVTGSIIGDNSVEFCLVTIQFWRIIVQLLFIHVYVPSAARDMEPCLHVGIE